MSEFADKQKNECEEIKKELEKEQEEIEEFCPSCVPDPYTPKIDWLLAEEPYFDPRTCEYIANVSFHKAQDVFQNGISTSITTGENTFNEVTLTTKKTYLDLRSYAEDQKLRGTEILLKHFGKKLTKEVLSLSTIPEDGIIISPSNSVINLKIVIVAERFNAIGEMTEEDLEQQEQPENNTEFPSTLTIDDSNFDLWEKLITTQLGILAYEGKYSYFRTIEDGVIKYDTEGELLFFKPEHLRTSLEDFKKALDKLLNLNGMSFYSVSSYLGIYDTATKIEIEFDNSNEIKPFKIHKIFATTGQCPRKELIKGLDVFKEKGYSPTALFYMTNFQKAHDDLIAPEPRDWIEFFEEYTYPPIQVIYGSSGAEEKITESGLACALDADLGELASGLMEDFFHSAWDVFSNSFDLVSCSDEPTDREPALKEFIRPDEQEAYEKFYKEELKRLRKDKREELNAFASGDFRNIETTEELEVTEEAYKKEREELEADLREQASQKAEEKVNKMSKKNFAHPFYQHFKDSLKQRFDNDQSILAIFKKVQKDSTLPESSKVEKFVQSVGMCGISNGFKKALGCLMKQVDIKTLITTAIKTFFAGFKVQDLSNALRDLFIGLPADKQVEVQLKIEEKHGKIKPPWETLTANPERKAAQKEENKTKGTLKGPDGKPLTEEVDGNQVPITKAALGKDTNKNTADSDGSSEFSRGINQAANQSIELILKTYMEEIFNAASVDDLIKKYKKEVPAISEILRSVQGDCNTSPVKDINNSLLPDYKFDVCNPTAPALNFKIPKIQWKPNIWKNLRTSVKKAIREAIIGAISALVTKLINLLEQKLCDSLSAVGKTGLDMLANKGVDFGEILRDSFCPDASDDEVKDLGNSLLNKIGAKDTGAQNAFDCFTGAIFGSMTQREMIDLITLKQKNSVDIQMFMQTIKVGCPDMYDLVNTPSRAENFFNNIGNLIPQDTRDLLQASQPFSSDGVPFYNSICLTSEELRAWDQSRRQGLENAGLSPEDAASQVDLYNERARDALSDVLDTINNGPNNDLNDMIQDMFSPLADDPCDKKNLKEGESLFGNKVAREPEDTVKIQDDISNKIFDNVLEQVTRDFSKSFGLGGSLLERILTDTRDNNQAKHNLFKSWIISRNKYHDSETTQQQKEGKFSFFGLDFTGEHRGFYPETIGIHCKYQLEANSISYVSTVATEEEQKIRRILDFPVNRGQTLDLEIPEDLKEKASFEFVFERSLGDGLFTNPKKVDGKISFISADLSSPGKSLSYKINSTYRAEIAHEDVAYNEISNIGLESLTIEENPNVEYRALVFNAFINKKLESLNTPPDMSNIQNFISAIQSVFSEAVNLILNNTEGFQFGFEDEDLQEEDLAYVNPQEGSTEYTYENADKILGRSKTDHPRVTFLNPENYGGSYKVPPVYIKPKEMNGWMKYSKDLFPEEEECEPKTQTIINNRKIKKFINDRRNSSTMKDDEMKKMSEKCYFERPFDKALTKNAIASIEGLIKTQIRTSIVKEIIKNMPVLSCLEYNSDNFDKTSAQTIVNRLVQELKTVNPFGPYKLEKQNYYLIFLEQAVQFFITTTIKDLPNKIDPETGEEIEEKDFSELGENLEKAYNKIKSFTDGFNYLNTVVPKEQTIQLLGAQEIDSSILSVDNFNALAGAYQKVGDYMFNTDSFYDYKPDFLQSKATTNLYSVLFAIRLCEKEAQTILKYLIDLEYEEIISELYKRNKAIIKDIGKALLTSGELFEENKIQNFGFTQYEDKISIGSFQSMGQPNDVVDTVIQQPFSDSEQFKMKIERYIRIKEKEELDLPEQVTELLNSRNHNLKGVVSLENLQSFFDENIDVLGEYNISDLFGDAELIDTELSGDIGLNTGIRIIINLPSMEEPERNIPPGDIEYSIKEKAYYITGMKTGFSLPICTAEVNIRDMKIKDLDLEGVYDVDCLARKMTNSSDYKLLFKKIIPIQSVSSMTLQYMNYFFLDSIGVTEEREEEVENPKRIQMPNFNRSNLQIRKYFACFYNSNRNLHSENFRIPRIEFPDFWKMLFGGFNVPEINLNLILPSGNLGFGHKVIEVNPFNENDQSCDE